jgi:hypothetical protein
MERWTDLRSDVLTLCPFVVVYFSGVCVRINREHKQQPRSGKARINLALAGEALPGLFEMVVTLAALFGVVLQAPDATRFQMMGILGSAGFLAFRGGYTYQESLLAVNKHAPAPQAAPGALKD